MYNIYISTSMSKMCIVWGGELKRKRKTLRFSKRVSPLRTVPKTLGISSHLLLSAAAPGECSPSRRATKKSRISLAAGSASTPPVTFRV